MSSVSEYRCTGGEHVGPTYTPRELLLAKRVQFVELGTNAKQIRTRVVDWLCPDCVKKDSAWNQEKWQGPAYRLDEPLRNAEEQAKNIG